MARITYTSDSDSEESKSREAGSAANDRTQRPQKPPPMRSCTFLDKQWNDTFERLTQYKLEHGDCLVPKRYNDDPSLGLWVSTQRIMFKRGTMDLCRFEQLHSIGFCWEPLQGGIYAHKWNGMYEQLKRYKLEYGDCLVPKNYKDDPSLGEWVSTQRKSFNRGAMDHCRVEQLTSIGFCWEPLKRTVARKFYTGVEHLVVSVNRNRKAQEPPPCYENNGKAPPYSSPDSIVSDGPKRRSAEKTPAHSKKKTENAKRRPSKAASPKAMHNLKRPRKMPNYFSPDNISDDGPNKWSTQKPPTHSKKSESTTRQPTKASSPKVKQNSNKNESVKIPPAKAFKAEQRKEKDWLAVSFEKRVSEKKPKPWCKAQEPPCYENSGTAPQYSSPDSIVKDGLRNRRSGERTPAQSNKKTESAKRRPAKAASPKAKHSSKRPRKVPNYFSPDNISDDVPNKRSTTTTRNPPAHLKKKSASTTSHAAKAASSKVKQNSSKNASSKIPPAKAFEAKQRKDKELLAVPFEKRSSEKEPKPRWTPEDIALFLSLRF